MASSIGETPPLPVAADTRELDRDIWAMAWPTILSLIVVNLVDIVDVALVGRLGRETVAAWGYATQCINLVETLIQAVGIACVALVARALGARDPGRARRALAGSMLVSETVALAGFLLALLIPKTILGWLDATPQVAEIAVPYFRLFAGAMLLFSAAFMFESGFRARKMTRAPMVVAVVVMAVKTALSVVLIFGFLGFPQLGLVGAGVATLAAHGVGLLLYIGFSRRAGVAEQGDAGFRFRLDDLRGFWEVASDVARVALPSMGERLLMSTALLAYFRQLSGYGTAAVAAYAIGVRLLALSWVPGIAFGTAASAFVGHALGAGDSARARHVGVRSLVQASMVMGALGVLFLFLRNPLAAAFAGDARIAECLAPVHDDARHRPALHGCALHAGRRPARRGRHGDAPRRRRGRQLGAPGPSRRARVSHPREPLVGVGRAHRRPLRAHDDQRAHVRLRKLGQASRRTGDPRQDLRRARPQLLTTPRVARGATSRRRSRGRFCPPWP